MVHFSENRLGQNLRWILYVYGLWPEPTTHPLYKVYSTVLHIVMPIAYSICMTVNFLKNINDVDQFTLTLTSSLAVLSTFFKLVNYMYYKGNIIECYTKLSEIQKYRRSNDKIFYAKFKSLNTLTLIIYSGANCTVFAAIFKTLISTEYELPIPSWYPLDWKHNRRDYWIVYTHNMIGAFIVGNLNITMDCYAYYLLAMVTAQFEMLYEQIEELGKNSDKKDFGMSSHKSDFGASSHKAALADSVMSIKLCLKEHQNILQLVSDIEYYFSLQFLTQICLSGATLSTSIYQLNTVSPSENIFRFAYLLAFLFSVTVQTFLYTYYANGIVESSNSLSNAVYFSKWYRMLPESRKYLIVFMERLKRKSQILAGRLFPVNLELFTDIMDLSYRLYLFLKSF